MSLDELRTALLIGALAIIVPFGIAAWRAESRLAESAKEKEVLLKELHHRVKNNLQLISSLFSLQAQAVTDQASRNWLGETEQRLLAIALVHEKLYEANNFSTIDFGDYIQNLGSALLAASRLGDRISLNVDVRDFTLPIHEAIPCGLIINELLTNSIKHGFPEGSGGSIGVDLKRLAVGWELTVWDDGAGLPADMDLRQTDSLGWQVVSTLAKQLELEIRVNTNGRTAFQLVSGGKSRA